MPMLLNGDCLEEMKGLDNDSVDFIFCDLPYGQTSCKWDTPIDLDEFWKQVMRVKKLNTPIFMTTTTKFGASLINSAPKKCPFRYDLVWVKSAPAGFLLAKKMPMRKHEMIYVFYEKLPFYDLSSHKHKFLKNGKEGEVKHDGKVHPSGEVGVYACGKERKTKLKKSKKGEAMYYDPPLPVSVVKDIDEKYKNKGGLYSKVSRNGLVKNEPHYDPPLPTSVVKEETNLCKYDVNKNAYGGGKEGRIKISKDKKDHQQKYDPPLPVSVVKEPEPEPEATMGDCYGDVNRHLEQHKAFGKRGKNQVLYDPPLPNTLLEIKSTRGKHSTEKPVALMEWLLKYYSREGDVVLDPTMGSGSTGVACNNMNRNFIGIELDPQIYEVAVNRIED